MRRSFLALAALIAGTGAVLAQAPDPITARKDAFKSWGAAAREPGQMLRGEAAFDLAKAQNLLKTLAEGAPKMAALFPESSKSGDTKALPVIWEKKADFDALFVKLANDATAAQAAIKDEASFKTELPKVLGNCGACHNTYRAK
jgi:cytochrome c556